MNENNYCKKCNSDIPFRPCPVCKGDFEEPTIKVSELREWVQDNYFYSKEKGSLLIEAYDLLIRFCRTEGGK